MKQYITKNHYLKDDLCKVFNARLQVFLKPSMAGIMLYKPILMVLRNYLFVNYCLYVSLCKYKYFK